MNASEIMVKKVIKTKLLQYLEREISKEELCDWSVEMMHYILKGDILEIKWLEVWGILTGLAEVEDYSDRECTDLVGKYNRILSGDEAETFSFAMRIPEWFVEGCLSKVGIVLQKHLDGERQEREDISELEEFLRKRIQVRTIHDLLELEVIDLLNLGFDVYAEENGIACCVKSTLFISEEMSKTLERNLVDRIFSVLECWNGKKSFFVHVRFHDGAGEISIQI